QYLCEPNRKLHRPSHPHGNGAVSCPLCNRTAGTQFPPDAEPIISRIGERARNVRPAKAWTRRQLLVARVQALCALVILVTTAIAVMNVFLMLVWCNVL